MNESLAQDHSTPASQLMVVELISNLLAATQPRELGRKLTEQLRELTGARTVLLIEHQGDSGAHGVLSACPERRGALFTSEELRLFCPEHAPDPLPRQVAELPPDHPLRAALVCAGVESLLRFPLCAGGELLGMLLLLDQPALDRIDEAAEIITLLSPPIALALRNTMALDQIEQQRWEIQRHAGALEERVKERTAELAAANADLVGARLAALNMMEDAVAAKDQLEKNNQELRREIMDRERAEGALRQSEQRKTILNQIAHIFLTLPDEEMYTQVLSVVLQAMKSKFGIFGYIGTHGDLVVPSLTGEVWSECKVSGKSVVFSKATWGKSLWGRAIRESKTFCSDGPFHTPKGHVHIDHFLAVPIVFGNTSIGLLAVANAEQSYTKDDKELLESIAGSISPILNARMQRDLQEQKRQLAEEEIHKLNAELELRVVERTAQLAEANKELESFSYSVSHDLRAPLRAIDGFANMLVEEHAKQLDEEGQRELGVISHETKRMGQLIDDLLSFSRMSRQSAQLAEVDMGALAQEVFDECAARASGRKLQFKLGPLPPARCDRALLRHVLVNLISNAIKYSRPKAVAEIEMGGRAENSELLYYVKDNGVGFNMKYVQKLFGVFQRLHTEEEFEGTGVGLAIVQRVIRRHGGRVWAESTLNEGATFYFTLPVRKAQP